MKKNNGISVSLNLGLFSIGTTLEKENVVTPKLLSECLKLSRILDNYEQRMDIFETEEDISKVYSKKINLVFDVLKDLEDKLYSSTAIIEHNFEGKNGVNLVYDWKKYFDYYNEIENELQYREDGYVEYSDEWEEVDEQLRKLNKEVNFCL